MIQAALAAAGNTAATPAATAPGAFSSPTGASGATAAVDEICGGILRGDSRTGPATRPIPTLDPGDITDLPWRTAPLRTPPDHTGNGRSATEDIGSAASKAQTISEPATDPQPAAPRARRWDSIDGAGEIIRGNVTEPLAGTRRYRLYVPSHAAGKPLPLVVMLHGCTQDAEDFARGTRMDEAARREGFAVLYPEQCAKANPQRCWHWFRKKDQGRDHGEPALLAGMVRRVIREHDLDAGRVFVAGLSAGGAMAAVLGRTHPDLFTAVGVHSGLAAGAASDLPSALGAMRGADSKGLAGGLRGRGRGTGAGAGAFAGTIPRIDPGAAGVGARAGDETESRVPTLPTIVFHGGADAIVHPSNGERVIAQATPTGGRIDSDHQQASAPPRAATKPGRRAATRAVVRDRNGVVVAEHWVVHGAPHAWSGGSPAGSYTDPSGPDATTEMVRFFLAQEARRPG